METIFFIQITMTTTEGPVSFARFDIGNRRDVALELFNKLQGSGNTGNANFLSMELMETVDLLPVNMQLINCTLDEVAYNCRLISKELFQVVNLKSDPGQAP